MMQINKDGLCLPHGLMLAPMAGVTDVTMRRICGEHGADYAVTEMVSAKALVYEQNGRPSAPAKTAALCRVSPEEPAPVAVQIFGSEPEIMAEAARLISTGSYRGFSGRMPAAVDINMGCPVRKVAGNGEGSALMKDPELIYRIVSAVSAASSLPVTVKLRAGWDSAHINAPECALAAQEGGAAAVCIHARTREQFYTPGIMPGVVTSVVSAVSIPVFGNGDIGCAADALEMMAQTGCSGVAIARGAIGNPWIFTEIASALDGKSFMRPSCQEILAAALRQLDLTVADKGERRGVAEVKYSLSHYVSGFRGAAAARGSIMNAAAAEDIKRGLTEFFSKEPEYTGNRTQDGTESL